MAELKGQNDVEINIPLIRHMIINAIRSYNLKFRSEYGQMVIACDNKKYWRKDIFPYYKAGRKKNREDSGFDWSAIFEALNLVKQELAEHFPYPVVEIDKAEADDIIATLAIWTQNNDRKGNSIFEEDEPQPVLILSGDHDFQQLQKYKNVKQYSPIQKKWIVPDESPNAILMEHIIRGDKGDGVPNFRSSDDVFVAGGRQKSITNVKLAEWKKLTPEAFLATLTDEQERKNFERNRALVDLALIPEDIQESIIKNYMLQRNVRDRSGLINFFNVHRMRNLLECVNDF